jgi:hypothetical protein
MHVPVLRFNGQPMSADFGKFWDANAANLGPFYWEVWCAPQGTFTGYMISDGYGGSHALLFGLTGGPSGYRITGNVFDGRRNTTFGSDEGPIGGEWALMGVGWDGSANIVTYYNGVPVGVTPFAGPRKAGPFNGHLYVGGSDHSNFNGNIAQVRGYEGVNPADWYPATRSIFSTASQDLLFYTDPLVLAGKTYTPSFVANFFTPTYTPLDLMGQHNGRLRGSANGSLSRANGFPAPQYVLDPTSPTYDPAVQPKPYPFNGTKPPVPSGALIFDSFSSPDTGTVFDNYVGGLGSTEGGSRGSLAWTDSPTPGSHLTGVINGKVYDRGNGENHYTYVDAGRTDVDVRVNRVPGTFLSGISTGIMFRYIDANNYCFAYTQGTAANNQRLVVGKRVDGTFSYMVTGAATTPSWTTLRVISKGNGTLQVYAGEALVYSTTDQSNVTGTRVGLYVPSSGMDLAMRWDDFTVFDAP